MRVKIVTGSGDRLPVHSVVRDFETARHTWSHTPRTAAHFTITGSFSPYFKTNRTAGNTLTARHAGGHAPDPTPDHASPGRTRISDSDHTVRFRNAFTHARMTHRTREVQLTSRHSSTSCMESRKYTRPSKPTRGCARRSSLQRGVSSPLPVRPLLCGRVEHDAWRAVHGGHMA